MENIFSDQNGVRCDFRTAGRVITNLTWPIAGVIGISVITISAAIGVLCGCSDEKIRAGLLHAGEESLRIRVFQLGNRILMEDCYNASPEAMIAAFESLAHLASGRPKVAVLGDMLELGSHSTPLHEALGETVVKCGFYALFTCGCAAYGIARGARRAGISGERIHSFEAGEWELLAEAVLRHTPPNAAILLKGSRAMHLERVSKAIRRMS